MEWHFRIWMEIITIKFNKERKINGYLKKLKALGWEMPGAMETQPA